ncbi:MAG TPA: adenylosuccinate lyase, partial [Candidatus Dormibacteraeota bacterium]|nr:adenylosuccinate lyase [Candidatus Dormibacteraeota bacterium]
MQEIWSDRHRFDLWLRIEVLACEAWSSLGRVPAEALPRIRAATVDPARIAEIEARVGHDLVAFLTAAGESIG